MTKQPESFASRLVALREARSLTPYALARKAGLTAQAVYDLEDGTRADPSTRTLRALAFGLGVGLEDLAGPPEKKQSV